MFSFKGFFTHDFYKSSKAYIITVLKDLPQKPS